MGVVSTTTEVLELTATPIDERRYAQREVVVGQAAQREVIVGQPVQIGTVQQSFFNQIDANHDGSISREEFNAALGVSTQYQTTVAEPIAGVQGGYIGQPRQVGGTITQYQTIAQPSVVVPQG